MKKAFLIGLALTSLMGTNTAQAKCRPTDNDTINYTAKEGIRYKMIVIGDKLPELYINNKKVSTEDLSRYDKIINLLEIKLEERKRKPKNS